MQFTTFQLQHWSQQLAVHVCVTKSNFPKPYRHLCLCVAIFTICCQWRFRYSYPCTGLDSPWGLQEVEASQNLQTTGTWNGKVVSLTHRQSFPPQEISPVLISDRGGDDRRISHTWPPEIETTSLWGEQLKKTTSAWLWKQIHFLKSSLWKNRSILKLFTNLTKYALSHTL